MQINGEEYTHYICPHCGYRNPIYGNEKSESKQVFFRCKGRNCGKFFELKKKNLNIR